MSIVQSEPGATGGLGSIRGVPDVDISATEFLNLPEFVVESYDIDHSKPEIQLHCRIRLDSSPCRHCRNLSGDMHQHRPRRVRDIICFGYPTYLIFSIRRFRCSRCRRVFTEYLDSVAYNSRYTRRFERWVYRECLGQTVQDVARKHALSWHAVENIFRREAAASFTEDAV